MKTETKTQAQTPFNLNEAGEEVGVEFGLLIGIYIKVNPEDEPIRNRKRNLALQPETSIKT